MLLVQADSRLGSIFLTIKQSEKLAVILPIPTRVADVNKPFILDLARDFTERWERVRRRRAFRSKPFFLGKPKGANPSENFQPRQKEPAHRADKTPHPAAGDKINAKKSGSENSERSGLLRKRILKAAQTRTEDGYAKCKKEAKKHQELIGVMWFSFRNFSSWLVSKLAKPLSPATNVGT